MWSQKKIIAVAISSAILSVQVQAAAYPKQNDPEEPDSVAEWGPWALPFGTAAGEPTGGVALAFASGGGDEYVFPDDLALNGQEQPSDQEEPTPTPTPTPTP
uniref:hypothetical protein n=1 Tax=Neptuniibacter sp. UBA847 TaxID=1946977 RepID=UPI0025CEB215